MPVIACQRLLLLRQKVDFRKLLMMKLTSILLFICCMNASANGYAQKVTLFEKDVALNKVFKKIKKQTGYTFVYTEALLKKAKKVSLTLNNASPREALDACFQDQELTYTILNKMVIIKEKEIAPQKILTPPPPAINITGKINNAQGEPLAGASVSEKGTANMTITKEDGSFVINVTGAKAVLVISFVGYETQEISVAGRNTITTTLRVSSQVLNEVVVVGYGTQRKRDLTGSITSVKGDEISRQPATNPVASLQGRIAGLTIVNSGRAGANPTVRIRGVNSTNNSDPLYVVDGIFQTSIDYLNPADIESIDVLRDPSSIAIFGLQGGNGVIIVTTKRAAKGKTRTSFQSSVGIQKVTDKIKVTDAAGFKTLYSAQLANLNAAPFDYTNYTANTNWQDLIFRDAIINSNSLSISTSGEKSTSLFNLGYNNQEGVLKYDRYQKFIARFNQEIKVNKNIKVGGDVTGFHWIQQNPAADLNNALWAAPIVPVQTDASTYYSMPSFQRAQVGNPIAALNKNNGNTVNKGYRFIGSIYGEVKFLENFTFKSAFYTDLGFNSSRGYTALPFSFINLGEGAVPTATTYDQSQKTAVNQSQSEFRKFQQDHTLTYDKTFRQVHHLTALAGFTTLYAGNTNVSGNRRDTTLNIPNDPSFWYLGIANQANPGTYAGSGGEESYMSFLSRVSYTYDNKYLINVTFRRDGSSKFAPGKRWGNFSSVGVGWVMSDERFIRKLKVFDFLKLRAAWGQVGSALGTGTNLYQPVLNTSNVGVFGNNVYSSVTPAYVPDPNLHWEVVNGVDVGLEMRTLNNRLSADVNFYNRTTKDILTLITLPGSAGNYSYYTNLGNISNKGVEISLGWRDRIGKEFTYSITPNFSYNKNRVESIGNNINFQLLGNGGVNKTETGQSIGYFYGYRQTGIYQATAELDKQPHMSNSLPGDIAYADINGDGVITPADRTYLGTPFPKFNFGINISLGYKNFDVILDGQGVSGNKIYTQRRTATFATLNYEANRLNAWKGAGTSNIEPILDNTRANNFLFSSYYLEPGDYFRFRTVQLGYTLKSKGLTKAGISQMRLYISGQNIHTFSKTTGYTPEASLSSPIASGADNGTYPVPAVYSLGVNVTF